MKKIVLIYYLLIPLLIFAQEIRISYSGSRNYNMVERTDLRRYDNGKYVGLVSREVRSFISPVSYESDFVYEGNFFVEQETRRADDSVGSGIHDSIPSRFEIASDGSFKMIEDFGYPTFRSFPTYINQKIKKGDSWTAKAERSVDPLNKGIPTKMPIYVQYTYKEEQTFHNEPVYLITAEWATRYGMGSGTSYIDYGGDRNLKKATGSHKANILVSKYTGATLVIRDTVDEVFVYADGKQVALKGTISMFTEYPPSVDTERLLPALQRVAMLTNEDSDKIINRNDLLKNVSEKGRTSEKEMSVESEFYKSVEKNVKKSEKQAVRAGKNDFDKIIASASSNINQNKPVVQVDTTPAGIRLTIQDLQFKADSSELLPGEEKRLDQISEVLKQAPDSLFLVEGHTASTGNPKGENKLSIERAHAIAEALSKRGISEGRFICKGSGGTKPVADNTTSEGKAKNRRVEITILE